MVYLPYIAIAGGFLLLFVKARGFFDASARYLMKRSRMLALYATEPRLKTALLLLFAVNILAALVTWRGIEDDTAAKGYLLREEYGGSDSSAQLIMESEEGKREVEVPVEARKLSRKECLAYLDQAEELLPSLIFGTESGDFEGAIPVRNHLTLPIAVGDLPLTLEWSTDRPDVLDDEGRIMMEVLPGDGSQGIPDSESSYMAPEESDGQRAEEEAEPVVLSARLICGEEVREISYELLVRPRVLSAEEAEDLSLYEQLNANDGSREELTLPSVVDGNEVHFRSADRGSGIALLFLGGIGALLYIYSALQKKQEERQKYEEGMEYDYPTIVSKLVLLVSAGLSLRKAFARICADYQKSRREGGELRPGYEELLQMMREMDKGIPEAEAYDRMGRRSALASYRTFSTLLVQNLTRGGHEMMKLLEREAADSFENRKKQARVLGEKAGTKLLFPMLLMLGVVMGIMVVPAFLSFF